MAGYNVIRSEQELEREGRDGRMRTRKAVLWAVVGDGGEFDSDHETRRAALARAKKLNDAITLPGGRKPVATVRD